MSGIDVLIAGFGLLCAGSAALAVTSPRVVHAALYLVLSLGALAGVYLAMGAEIVGLVQLLVYVGAVVVLLLFALMLTRAPADTSTLDHSLPRRILALVVAAGATAVVLGALLSAEPTHVPPLTTAGQAAPLGGALFTSWVLPFELISILLLAALVAAVSLSRAGARDEGEIDS